MVEEVIFISLEDAMAAARTAHERRSESDVYYTVVDEDGMVVYTTEGASRPAGTPPNDDMWYFLW